MERDFYKSYSVNLETGANTYRVDCFLKENNGAVFIDLEQYVFVSLFGDGVEWSLRSIRYDGEKFEDILNESSDAIGMGVAGSDGIEAYLELDPSLDIFDTPEAVEDFIALFESSGLKTVSKLGVVPLIRCNNDVIPLFTFDSTTDISMEEAEEWTNSNSVREVPGAMTEFMNYGF